MYKDPATQNGSLRKEVRSYELILTLRRRFFWIFSACVLAFAFTYWLSADFFQYRSKVLVDVSPAPVFLNSGDDNSQSVDIFRSSEYVMRILQFVHSNKMTDHLIKKFDLYAHYGIDPSSKYAYERVNLLLNRLTEARRSPFDNVVISFSDRDRDFAALMANEIAAHTDVLAREYFSSVLAGKLAYYREVLKTLDEDFNRKTSRISESLSFIQLMKQSGKTDPELKSKLSDAENSLIASSSQMNDILSRIAAMKKSEQWIYTMMSNTEVQFISVMQKAIPDQSDILFSRLLLSLGASVAASFVAVLMIYFAKTYRPYFSLFFSR